MANFAIDEIYILSYGHSNAHEMTRRNDINVEKVVVYYYVFVASVGFS